MYGGLSKKGLIALEEKIDRLLNGRDPKSSDLEKVLKDMLEKYSYEVSYYNVVHKSAPFDNKYSIPTPAKYVLSLIIANFMANGVPTENMDEPLPEGKHPVTKNTMDSFGKSIEACLGGTPSPDELLQVVYYSPIGTNPFKRKIKHEDTHDCSPKVVTEKVKKLKI